MNKFKNQQYSSRMNIDTNCNVENASLAVTCRRTSTMDHVIYQSNHTSNRQARNTNTNRYEHEYESNDPELGGAMERRHSYQCDEAFDGKDCATPGASGNVAKDGDLNEASDLSQNQSKCGYFFIIGEVESILMYKN